MNTTEDATLEDDDEGLESVDSLTLSSADQALDELYTLLGESSSLDKSDDADVSVDSETSLSGDAVLEELQVMYSSSDDSITESDSTTEAISVMDELEKLYGGTDGVSVDDQLSTSTEAESAVKNVSVMDELEAMYGSATTPEMDDEPVDPIEGDTSSLDELEALLGDSFESSTEAVAEEIPLESTADSSNEEFEANDAGISSSDEYLFENRKPVLEELQNLLQSSVEELKERADSHIGKTILALDMEYPTRNELITLLEEKLNLLNNISDTSGIDSFDGSTSVLEEFNALMSEADSSKNTLDSTDALPNEGASLSDEVDEYVSYINAKYKESSGDEDVAESVIPDEFDDLLLDTDNTVDADVLNQLEEMMAEIETPEIEDVNKDSQVAEKDVVIQQKSTVQKDDIKPAEAHDYRLKARSTVDDSYLSDRLDDEKRLPIGIILLAVAIIAGLVVFWNLFGPQDESVDYVQPDRAKPVQTVVLAEPLLQDSSIADTPVETESIGDSPSVIESSKYVQESQSDEEFVEVPVQLTTPDDSSIFISSEASNELIDVIDETNNAWSVHLFSYYNVPPAESELEFLKDLGIPYVIKQASVNGQLWYRVQVFKHSEFSVAKKYAVELGDRSGIKGIWISKSKIEDN